MANICADPLRRKADPLSLCADPLRHKAATLADVLHRGRTGAPRSICERGALLVPLHRLGVEVVIGLTASQ